VESRFERKVRDLERRVLDLPGALDPVIRRAVAAGDAVPPDAVAYVDKVRRHAYRVTDGDFDMLRSAGYSEDQIFELTGAAAERLRAGLDALGAPSVSPDSEGGEA
jgi:alkylhydroperoxidase family enzyme